MGNNSSITQVPPGGALLWVRYPGCNCGNSWNESGKPPQLQPVSDAQWSDFSTKVGHLVSRMYKDYYTLLPLLGLSVAAVMPSQIQGILGAFAILGVPFMYYWTITTNQKVDKEIGQQCREFGEKTGCPIEYRTQFTGFCVPKGAKPGRVIAIGPAQAPSLRLPSAVQSSPAQQAIGGAEGVEVQISAGGPHVVEVQIPAGAVAGSTIQAQAPDGQMLQVVVPKGATQGQTIKVQYQAIVGAERV